jgi:phosphopantothenoylcysteine synthetase/decarboxylase
VEIIDDLLTVILDRLRASSFDAVIHAMAVLDYMPGRLSKGKIPSNKDKLTLTLTKTPKIIGIMREVWPETFFVSFKLEAGLSVDELIKRAYTSLKKNDVNLVVANDQNEIAGGKHRAYLIDSQKNVVSVCETKRDIAHNLMDVVSGHLRNLANKRQIKST